MNKEWVKIDGRSSWAIGHIHLYKRQRDKAIVYDVVKFDQGDIKRMNYGFLLYH